MSAEDGINYQGFVLGGGGGNLSTLCMDHVALQGRKCTPPMWSSEIGLQ